jgi:hypothetical protein
MLFGKTKDLSERIFRFQVGHKGNESIGNAD